MSLIKYTTMDINSRMMKKAFKSVKIDDSTLLMMDGSSPEFESV